MKKELELILVNKYPNLCRDYEKSELETCFHYGFECQDGWFNLIDQTLGQIDKIIQENEWKKILEKNEENKLWIYAGEKGRGKVLWPLRFALSGQQKSPDPFEIMKAVGIEATQRRIDNAILQLKNNLL